MITLELSLEKANQGKKAFEGEADEMGEKVAEEMKWIKQKGTQSNHRRSISDSGFGQMERYSGQL